MHKTQKAALPVTVKAGVREITHVHREYTDLLIESKEVARTALPGQFVMLKAWEEERFDPLLHRPFDISEIDAQTGGLRIISKVMGRGTRLMSRLTPGDEVTITGPLGTGITSVQAGSIGLLVRGVGAAAVIALAQKARAEGAEVITFLSASTREKLVCREYLEPVSAELHIATNDGSEGYHGDARDLVEEVMQRRTIDAVYTCGSRRFARFIQELHTGGRTDGYIFMEGFMACGIGDCHGCAVKSADREGYYLVCRDGPVFPADKVVIE
jgi:dihydroorotate dehydrogenase electron transfer subunit